MTDTNSPAELYAIQLSNKEPNFYAQIPGVIYHCTYVSTEETKSSLNYGKKLRKKLNPISIALYGILKQMAGQKSACWPSRDMLSELIGCSAGAITNAKKELMRPMEQLGGNALIDIEEKAKRHKNNKGATSYHLIKITFIWPENNAYMSTLKHHEKLPLGLVHNYQAMSCGDTAKAAVSPHDIAPLGALSPGDTNNRKQKKNHSVENIEPSAEAESACSPPNEESVIQEHEKLANQAKKALQKFGSDNNFIREMLKNFTPSTIIQAGIYTERQLRRKAIGNKHGYLRDAIEAGRVWNG